MSDPKAKPVSHQGSANPETLDHIQPPLQVAQNHLPLALLPANPVNALPIAKLLNPVAVGLRTRAPHRRPAQRVWVVRR
jgi:hypothetical protein